MSVPRDTKAYEAYVQTMQSLNRNRPPERRMRIESFEEWSEDMDQHDVNNWELAQDGWVEEQER